MEDRAARGRCAAELGDEGGLEARPQPPWPSPGETGEHGVGAEPAPLSEGPVEIDHGRVDEPLVQRVETGDRVGDLARRWSIGDRVAHACPV